MVDLARALSEHELITLRVIGEWWELDLSGTQKVECVRQLSSKLGELDIVAESRYLGPEEAAAFNNLVQAGGRVRVLSFERQHGNVRLMGPGKLEREEPWLDPVSAAEALWYKGLLFRGFEESAEGEVVEYFYLPDEYIQQFASESIQTPDAPREKTALDATIPPDDFVPAETDAVDDFVALLAYAQSFTLTEDSLAEIAHLVLDPDPARLSLLYALAWEMELLRATDEGARPTRTIIQWLKQTKEKQLFDLADAWSKSAWNDLWHTPGLICEGGSWENDPLLARTTLLDVLPRTDSWYRLDDLVGHIKETDPDFQRSDSSYDTWYIRDAASGEYISGFEGWNAVEGRLLKFLVTGPLFWFGMVDMAEPLEKEALNFRINGRGLAWLDDKPVREEEVFIPIVVRDDASILVPGNADRYNRFQIARVTEAAQAQPKKPFEYHLTPTSLERAAEQGVDAKRLLDFLEQASGRAIPASTRRAIERWSEQGTEARLEQAVVLRVRDAQILDKLRNQGKTSRYISESLGENAALVRAGDWEKLRSAAAQLGLLIDSTVDS